MAAARSLLIDALLPSVCKSDPPSRFNHTNDNHVQMEVSNETRSFSSKSHSIGRENDGPSSSAAFFKDVVRIFGELTGRTCRAIMTSVSNAALSPNVSTTVRRQVRRSLLHSCHVYIRCRMTVHRHPARSTTSKCGPCGPSLHSVKCSTPTVPCQTRCSSLDMASHSPRMNMTPSEWCSTRHRQ